MIVDQGSSPVASSNASLVMAKRKVPSWAALARRIGSAESSPGRGATVYRPAPAAGLPSGASTRPRNAIISPSPTSCCLPTTREAGSIFAIGRDPAGRLSSPPIPVAARPVASPVSVATTIAAAAIALSRAIIMLLAACFIRTIVV